GGRAKKVSKGWGTGRHEYDLQATPSWMAGADAPLALYCSHQDQVTALPSDATLIAGNDHCPHAVVAWGSDPDRPEAISVQAHPEYPRGYADGLFEVLRDKGSITAQQASDAVSSTAAGADGRRVAAWFVTYLRRHAAASAAA
ncbi:MAG: type 1 glutamine amidotransferase, partial [Pseudomonadota bacterium]